MNSRFHQLYWIIALFLFQDVAWAATVADISVKGNERTRTSYVKRMINVCLEQEKSDHADVNLFAAKIQQCLINSKLFSDVTIAIESQHMTVEVKEKWTLIPVPALTAGSGKNRRAGAFVAESNFLGMGMLLGMGGMITNGGKSYFALLSDPSIFFTNWNYTITGSNQTDEVILTEGKKDTDGFKETAAGVNLSIGYKWSRWALSGSLGHQYKKFNVFEDYAPLPNNVSNRAGLSATYDNRNYKLYFSEGLFIRANVLQELTREDHKRKVQQYDLSINVQQSIYNDQALQIMATGGQIRRGNQADAIRLGFTPGFRGIESKSAWAERYFATAIDYQIPLSTSSFGTTTTAPFFDAGRIYHRGGKNQIIDYYTVGGGVYFFLKSVALPGLGLEAGYNNKYQGTYFTATAGLSI